MNFKLFASAMCVAALCSCGGKQDNSYTLNVVVDDDAANGTTAYITNFDSGEKMDSAVINNGAVTFNGTIEEPTVVRLIINGNRAGLFILEEGVTEYKDGVAVSNLNEVYEAFVNNYRAKRDSILALIDTTMTQSEQEAIYNLGKLHLDSVMGKAIVDNASNPVGYMLFLQREMDMTMDKFQDFMKQFPHFAKYKRINDMKKVLETREATSAGKQFTDFEIEYNGTTTKLSDHMKPGEYTLVDFWASWCGPCKQEIEIIKQLYAKYGDKGLNVVGVTVWEDPEQTTAYLEKNPIPWTIMLNGQNGPTDLYGINGIPCIMLIDPDGKIVARDLFEDELVNTVATAMGDNNAR